MSSEHIETGRKLKQIAARLEFEEILDRCALSEEEKKIVWMHYLEKLDFNSIAKDMKMAESTARKWNRDAVAKISRIL